MLKLVISIILIAAFVSGEASAQSRQDAAPGGVDVEAVLAESRRLLAKGEACFAKGEFECARREFDEALDSIFRLGVDIRGDSRLHLGWRELVEKINRYQLDAVNGELAGDWKTQEFDGRPEQLRAEVEESDPVEGLNGPLTVPVFQARFSELRSRFREKYGRDIVLTGADHGEHTRLYGKGSAFDIRARDLNREQVQFIIKQGSSLGLRIKDFSTWQKVSAHNARSQELGRPLDTYATGLHLHIDRMAPYRKKMVARPVIKQKEKSKAASGTGQ